MAVIWVRLILKGLKALEDVPENLKTAVEAILNASA